MSSIQTVIFILVTRKHVHVLFPLLHQHFTKTQSAYRLLVDLVLYKQLELLVSPNHQDIYIPKHLQNMSVLSSKVQMYLLLVPDEFHHYYKHCLHYLYSSNTKRVKMNRMMLNACIKLTMIIVKKTVFVFSLSLSLLLSCSLALSLSLFTKADYSHIHTGLTSIVISN